MIIMTNLKLLGISCLLLLAIAIRPNAAISTEHQQIILDSIQAVNLTSYQGEPIPVYRLDKSDSDVCYYLVDMFVEYFLISVADQPGDNDIVDRGDLPSPTSDLDNEAAAVNKTCAKYFLVLPGGLMVCKDAAGDIVATTADAQFKEIAESSDGYTTLAAYILSNLEEYKKIWEEHAAQTEIDDDSNKRDAGDKEDDENGLKFKDDSGPNGKSGEDESGFIMFPIQPGGSRDIAVGENPDKVLIKYQQLDGESDEDAKEAEKKLCSAIENCNMKKGQARLSIKKIEDVPNTSMKKIVLKLAADAKETLGGKESVFAVVVKQKNGDESRVMMQVEYPPEQKGWYQYGSWTSWITVYRMPYYNMFPRYYVYNVNTVCQRSAAAVAWAGVFGYYDRRTHHSGGYGGSWQLYRSGSDGTTGCGSCLAAPYTNDFRMRGYMNKLSSIMSDHCIPTPNGQVHFVESFYRARQPGSARIIRYVSNSYNNGAANLIYNYSRAGWPVVTSIYVGYWREGVVTATAYKYRRYRYCYKVLIWTRCRSWRTQYQHMMLFYYGNYSTFRWYTLKATSAWVAVY